MLPNLSKQFILLHQVAFWNKTVVWAILNVGSEDALRTNSG